MQLAVFTAITTGLFWGIATFYGGRAARDVSPPLLTAIYNLTAGLIFTVLFIFSDERASLSTLNDNSTSTLVRTFIWGTIGGAYFAIGLTAITFGLSKGRSAVVGPIASTIEVLLPFIYAIAVNELPNDIAIAGIVILFFVPYLVTRTNKKSASHSTSIQKDVSLGALSGLGFGFYYLALIIGPEATPFLTMTIVQISSAIAMLGVHSYLKKPWKISSTHWKSASIFVAFETAGALTLRYAITNGSPSVVSTLAAIIYVASLLLLSYLIIKEKFSKAQIFGFILTFIGVSLVVLNT